MKKQVLSILGAGAVAFGLAGLAEATPIITDGLVAAYEFSGDATDSSGNGNNGAVYGASLTSDRLGNTNSAYSFDGTNDYIAIGNNSQLNFGLGDFSVSFWINSQSTNSQMVYQNGGRNGAVDAQYYMRLNDNFGDIHFNTSSAGNLSSGTTDTVENTLSATDGDWHNVVSIRNGTSNSIYIDGYLAENFIGTIQNVSSRQNLIIGGQWIFGEFRNAVWGNIDDVYFYDRALSNVEVDSLYSGTAPVPEPATMLLFGTGLAGLAGTRLRRKKK